jgi:ribosomal protein L23
MKKVGIALAVVLALGIALLVGLSSHGFRLGGVGVNWGPDEALLEQKAKGFLESIQYKRFDNAATFHAFPDQAKANIPQLIERLFAIKPEQLKMDNIKITRVTIDSNGMNGRTFFTASVTAFNSARKKTDEDEEREVEGVLYWSLRPKAEGEPPPGFDPANDEEANKTRRRQDEPIVRGPSPEPHREGDQDWYLNLESSLH